MERKDREDGVKEQIEKGKVEGVSTPSSSEILFAFPLAFLVLPWSFVGEENVGGSEAGREGALCKEMEKKKEKGKKEKEKER